MAITVTPINDRFVAEVSGVDLRDPVSDDDFAAIHEAFLEHSILVFHDQPVSDQQHVAFSRRFGELVAHAQGKWNLPHLPEVLVLANRGDQGTRPLVNGGAYWHSDMTYAAEPPLGSLLHGIQVPPEGGATQYCDMYAAWESLDAETRRRIAPLRAVHRYADRYRQMAAGDPERPPLTEAQLAALPDATHPVVRTHPETGRKALFVNEGFTVAIEGLPGDEGRALLDALNTHATAPGRIYTHQWRPHDLVLWDNRCTMHRATPYDPRHVRNMHRTTIRGDRPA